jgi:hypothetical protein
MQSWSPSFRACVPAGQNFVPPDAVSPSLRHPSLLLPWYQHVHWSGVGIARQHSCGSHVELAHASPGDDM